MSRQDIRLMVLWVFLAAGGTLVGCRRGTPTSVEPAAVERVYERGPVTLTLRLDQDEISLAQRLRLTLEVTHRPGFEIDWPRLDGLLNQFGIVDWTQSPDRLVDGNRILRQRHYILEPFLSGDYELPALSLGFRDPNDPNTPHTVTTEPVPVKVTSLLDNDRNDLALDDIHDVVDPPPPSRAAWLGAGGLGLLLIGLGLGLWYRRRRRPAALARRFLPAHEVAYRRLRTLVAQNLIETGRVKVFYQQVSAVLRHYIEDRFGLRAPEQTTEEFLESLRRSPCLTADQQAGLRTFLEHCDLVKFAKHQPGQAEIQQAFDHVKAFIEATRSDEALVDVTDGPFDDEALTAGGSS